MDKRLKQRLVGASVLVALAVIIVPELIRWPAEPEPPVVSATLPPLPETVPTERGVTISLPPSVAPTSEPFREPPVPEEALPPPVVAPPREQPSIGRELPEPAPASPVRELPEPAPASPVRELPEPVPASPVRELPEPTGAAVVATPPPPPVQPAATLPKIELIARSQGPITPATPPPPTAAPRAAPAAVDWMVQTGSFALARNADILRGRLRQQGFSVIVEPVRADGRTLYRVRVGPQSSREESEQVAQRLRQTGIGPAQVVPPGE